MNRIAQNTYQNIIWDWNGTLLNDVGICVQAINSLLVARKLPPLTETTYKQVFTFPVQQYYLAIGFNFSAEPFEIPAMQFIEMYLKLMPLASLYPNVRQVLANLQSKKVNQFILSAMEQKQLEQSINDFHITEYFSGIYGISDHFARSKVNRGVKLIENEKLDVKTTLLIGDTLHDVEVAEALGVSCVLVSQGHFAENRLRVNGNCVINTLTELF